MVWIIAGNILTFCLRFHDLYQEICIFSFSYKIYFTVVWTDIQIKIVYNDGMHSFSCWKCQMKNHLKEISLLNKFILAYEIEESNVPCFLKGKILLGGKEKNSTEFHSAFFWMVLIIGSQEAMKWIILNIFPYKNALLFNSNKLRYSKCNNPALWLCVCAFRASDVYRTMLKPLALEKKRREKMRLWRRSFYFPFAFS